MKKFSYFLLFLIALLFSSSLFLETNMGQAWLEERLNRALKKTGATIEIGHLQGALPSFLKMEKVLIHADGLEIAFESLETRLSIFPLLKGEIVFSHVKGKKGSLHSKTQGPFTLPSHLVGVDSFSFEEFSLPHLPILDLKGSLHLPEDRRIASLKLKAAVSSTEQAHFNLEVDLFPKGQWEGKIEGTTPTLALWEIASPIDGSFQGEISFKGAPGSWRGKIGGKFDPMAPPPSLEGPWEFSAPFFEDPKGNWHVSSLYAKNNLIRMKGKGELSSSFQIETGQIDLETSLLPLSPSFRLFSHLDWEKNQGKGTFRIPKLFANNLEVANIEGSFETSWIEKKFDFLTSLTAEGFSESWEGKGHLHWDGMWDLVSYSLSSPIAQFEGSKEKGNWSIFTLHPFSSDLYGEGKGTYLFENNLLSLDSQFAFVYWKDLFLESIQTTLFWPDPFGQGELETSWQWGKGRWKEVWIEKGALQTSLQGENWPLTFALEGIWKDPFSIEGSGFYRQTREEFSLSIEEIYGSFFNHPLILKDSLSFQVDENGFVFNKTSFDIGEGTATVFFQKTPQQEELSLDLANAPLDLLSKNALEIPMEGGFDLSAFLKKEGKSTTGSIEAKAEQMSLSAKFLEERATLDLNAASLGSVSLAIPFDPTEPLSGKLLFNGPVDKILDFVDLGSHRIEGDLQADLSLSGSLEEPLIEGKALFAKGAYQNYKTGTEIQGIEALWRGKGKKLLLEHLKGQDMRDQGTIQGKGAIEIVWETHCPFWLDLLLKDFSVSSFDLAQTELSGPLEIRGDLQGALAQGSLEISSASLFIPDRIGKTVPQLDVVYINETKPILEKPPSAEWSYPLNLALHLKSPPSISIQGRGLSSTWEGDLFVEGTLNAIAAQGKIDLVEGEFLLAGKRFKLTEGSLSFHSIPNEIPFLNLAAMIDVKDISIIARLKGPLNNPQVTLQSTPPLPMGTIMSYLLFGQNMSEISSLQALQLANSIASLAGQSPGILEQTRKSLGVDRLEITTIPNPNAEGGETIAVQVGKYVTEDVLVSVTQGAEDAGTNISIEVEVRGGLSFVLESQQAQEQGKFTLRWSKNY